MTLPPIIYASELSKLYTANNIVIIDASNGKNAQSEYEVRHLEGALYMDLDTQLADIKEDASIGGRHPLPKIEHFAQILTNLGISSESHIIIYDSNNGSNASARLWWMLKSIGHEKVQVLNGGFKEAIKNKFTTSSKTETYSKKEPYKVDNWKLKMAEIKEVEEVSQSENHLIIDVRSSERYRGESEPIDLVAGHIPGAINIPFTENLDENGLFLSPEILKAKYESILKNITSDNIIVHCGSGVTACHTLLAIAYAGLEIPKLYVGSWSEWSRNNKAIATI